MRKQSDMKKSNSMMILDPSALGAFLAIVAHQDDTKVFKVCIPERQNNSFRQIMNRNKLIKTYYRKNGDYIVELK